MSRFFWNFDDMIIYSGCKANKRPISLVVGERVLKVEKVLDRWFGEDHDYFKLMAYDGCTYIIRYDRGKDEWELMMMERE